MKIKDFALQEQPRERLAKHGPTTLSNAELLALILRQGSPNKNVLQLSNQLLNRYTLNSLSKAPLSELKRIRSIGPAKASQLLATFELARRLASYQPSTTNPIKSAKDVAQRYQSHLNAIDQEHFLGIYLDTRKRIIKEKLLFIGTLNTTVIHPREIFKPAFEESASSVIIVHNHPSGDPTPSSEDITITKTLTKIGNLLDIPLLDHIILGHKTYTSLREHGYLEK